MNTYRKDCVMDATIEQTEKRVSESNWDGYVTTHCGENWTPAIAKRFEALYPNLDLRVRGVWGGLCYYVNAKIDAQGWPCLADVAEFVENWKRGGEPFQEAAARAQGVLEMVPDLTELTVGNVRMGVVDGRLVDWREHVVAPPESDIPL